MNKYSIHFEVVYGIASAFLIATDKHVIFYKKVVYKKVVLSCSKREESSVLDF